MVKNDDIVHSATPEEDFVKLWNFQIDSSFWVAESNAMRLDIIVVSGWNFRFVCGLFLRCLGKKLTKKFAIQISGWNIKIFFVYKYFGQKILITNDSL